MGLFLFVGFYIVCVLTIVWFFLCVLASTVFCIVWFMYIYFYLSSHKECKSSCNIIIIIISSSFSSSSSSSNTSSSSTNSSNISSSIPKVTYYRPWQTLKFPGYWGCQILKQSKNGSGKNVSPTHGRLYPKEYSWYSYLLKAEDTPIS
jgi:hypothetical protein